MVLYTIVPLEYIFDDFCEEKEGTVENEVEILQGKVRLLASRTGNTGTTRVTRLISTNAQDYLNPIWQPGQMVSETGVE